MTGVITILHTPGCPGADEAAKVARALADSHAGVTVEMVVIEDEAQAVSRGFRGSPTVLVNGSQVGPDPETPIGSMG